MAEEENMGGVRQLKLAALAEDGWLNEEMGEAAAQEESGSLLKRKMFWVRPRATRSEVLT